MVRKIQRYLLDRMVLRPSRDPIEFAPQRREMLAWNGFPLECFVWSEQADATQPIDALVLKFPGTAGRAERSTDFPIEYLPTRGGKVWTWNPPGYGGSGGTASLGAIAEAAVEFWQQVTRRDATPETPILLCGNSLGCAAALRVAAEADRKYRRCGVILRNPPPLIPVVRRVAARYPLGHWIAGGVVDSLSESMNAPVTASRVTRPAVFLQSELDSLVPPALQQQVVAAYAGEKRVVVMEGLEHHEVPHEQHEPPIRRAIEWLWNTIQ